MKAIITKFHPATVTLPARVSAREPDGNRATITWDQGQTTDENHREAVLHLVEKLGWNNYGDLKYTQGSLKGGEQVFTVSRSSTTFVIPKCA